MIKTAGGPVASLGTQGGLSLIRAAQAFPGRQVGGLTLLVPALLCLGMATPARALVIQVTYDSSITNLGNAGSTTTAAVENAFNAVATAFGNAISNNVTVSIGVGWGEVNGQTVASGNIGQTTVNTAPADTYSQVSALLLAANPGLVLPGTDPANSLIHYLIPDAEALALGLSPSPSANIYNTCNCDGYIGFDSTVNFTFNNALGVAANTYDFTAAAEHEVEEALGRDTGLISASTPLWSEPLDILRYTAQNTQPTYNSAAYNTPSYLSTDGGRTDLGTLNSAGTGDRSDWATPGNTTDAQNAAMPTGTKEGLSISDEAVLQGIGWKFNSDTGTLFAAANAPAGATASVNAPVNAPEPASLSVLLFGAGALGFLRRRRAG